MSIIPMVGATVPSSLPVPIPTSPAVPIPGTVMFNRALISPPFTPFGFALNFGCGFRANGTLSIDVETEDGEVIDVAQVEAPVGS